MQGMRFLSEGRREAFVSWARSGVEMVEKWVGDCQNSRGRVVSLECFAGDGWAGEAYRPGRG